VNDIKLLKAAVEKAHNCKAIHCNTVSVKEKFRGKVAWSGQVEVFKVVGSVPPKRCYAWNHPEDEANTRTRIVTVLEFPPIDSPQAAVRAAIASEYRQNRAN
jgi:hypothetical protein